GGDARAGNTAREGERSWRRLRARPSDRGLGRTHPRHAARGPAEVRPAPRHGIALHRRRGGDCDGGGTAHVTKRGPRMPAPIEFYFDFSSPYGYMASTRIDAIAARHGRSVN